MKKIQLEIIALSHSFTQAHSYTVVLDEVSGSRRLPIVIGAFEAQAIAVALEKIRTSRPLTHDLMKNFMRTFNIELVEIVINDLQEGVFYAKLLCVGEHDTIEIDSRTSDALALALRFGCPIYTYEHILESASIMMEGTGSSETEEETKAGKSVMSAEKEKAAAELSEKLKRMTIEELNKLLNEVLEQEDYIQAIAIRDEINNRKK